MVLWISLVSVPVVIVVVLVLVYAWTRKLNRRSGRTGVVERSRLHCPKCGKTFDYEWVPLAAATAVRLGSSRYMACPLCHHWSTFNVAGAVIPEPTPPAP